jgi:hypothetical protein
VNQLLESLESDKMDSAPANPLRIDVFALDIVLFLMRAPISCVLREGSASLPKFGVSPKEPREIAKLIEKLA